MTVFYINQEDIADMITELNKAIGNERGVKLTFHTGDKEVEGTNRTFKSTFFFIKPVAERGVGGPGMGKSTKVVASNAPSAEETAAKIAAIKANRSAVVS